MILKRKSLFDNLDEVYSNRAFITKNPDYFTALLEKIAQGYADIGSERWGDTPGHALSCQSSQIRWGEGQHQFLFAGATLKKDDGGKVTGIDKEAFDATWEIMLGYSQSTLGKIA